MRERVNFQQRGMVSDGSGGQVPGPFTTVFTCAAEYLPLRGGEGVVASRLQGIQPYIVRVRSSAATRAVTTAWQIKDTRTNKIMNIRAVSDPDGKRQWLEFLAVAGELS